MVFLIILSFVIIVCFILFGIRQNNNYDNTSRDEEGYIEGGPPDDIHGEDDIDSV